jgi:hypothetical protein
VRVVQAEDDRPPKQPAPLIESTEHLSYPLLGPFGNERLSS